ncbi:hypothetical protein V5N11_014811 [Cardamine amara subsp. amara]|uniref:Uncharacterized protein n=1 Tax=Cardamine amara subsp. amara TaxID=228776 RepID=A0ABD1A5L1_CARAN
MSTPTFLEDGTPVVQAPPSVILKASELWKGYIVAQFHGLSPPLLKIYNDLNPIWDKYTTTGLEGRPVLKPFLQANSHFSSRTPPTGQRVSTSLFPSSMIFKPGSVKKARQKLREKHQFLS